MNFSLTLKHKNRTDTGKDGRIHKGEKKEKAGRTNGGA